ncbi:P-loop containing nucleoside triphosphate hydrolase protein [Marasmius fiardii PR-910]|nr:P-loop containing nucleoside triphosphate hydrolase protein [Marasmius fiardii PR-910]
MVASKVKRNTVDDDPLTRAIAPPPNETSAEREARLAAEQLAKKRSDQIDEEINQQRLAEKKEQAAVKVLLLGQSESGKTTTIKNFQLISQPKAFRSELPLWRAIIQLNVTRSIRIVLDAMSSVQAMNLNSTSTSPTSTFPLPNADYSPVSRPSSSYSYKQESPKAPLLTPEQLKLKMRLSPLMQVEEALMRKLSPSSPSGSPASQLSTASFSFLPGNRSKEISVYSASGWKGAFAKFMAGVTRSSMDSTQGIDFEDPEDPGVILHNCSEDMVKLWNDEGIRKLLETQNLRLEDMSGFFLDSLERITALKYVPSNEDILRARLKTIGVTEHRFVLKTGNMLSRDWKVFDVGGARNLVSAWAPYFDDMDAIIFLAPLSCFDQSLAEDFSVNRLEDSILLWRSIVKHPLLQKTELILFLNKCDLLRAKLDSGTQFSQWVVSYGDRPNTFESVASYMKKKFGTIHKQHSDSPRTFYCHFTSVTNASTTFRILENVKDLIIKQSLTTSHLV